MTKLFLHQISAISAHKFLSNPADKNDPKDNFLRRFTSSPGRA